MEMGVKEKPGIYKALSRWNVMLNFIVPECVAVRI